MKNFTFSFFLSNFNKKISIWQEQELLTATPPSLNRAEKNLWHEFTGKVFEKIFDSGWNVTSGDIWKIAVTLPRFLTNNLFEAVYAYSKLFPRFRKDDLNEKI